MHREKDFQHLEQAALLFGAGKGRRIKGTSVKD